MPHLTGHDIRAEIENLAQSLAEYGHWPEEREGAVRVLRDLSRRLEQKGVGGVDPGELDRARSRVHVSFCFSASVNLRRLIRLENFCPGSSRFADRVRYYT